MRVEQERLDEVDRRIIAALQIHGRATWQEIARATGVSDSTVARRTQRLFAKGLTKVIATTEPLLCAEGYPVIIGIRSSAGSITQVARALSQRTDVRFAALLTGSFDLVVELIVKSHTDFARVLLTEIDRIPGVWSTTTENVLTHYKLEHTWLQTELSVNAVNVLTDQRGPVIPGPPRHLDERERKLVDLLGANPRASIAQLSSQLGISQASVRRRIDKMVGEGRLRFSIVIDPELLGFTAPTMYWLHMDLSYVDEAAQILSHRPEVRYVAATAGHSDITVETVLRDQADLHRFNTQVIGGLPGVQRVEVGQELATLRRAFVLNQKTFDLINITEAETHG